MVNLVDVKDELKELTDYLENNYFRQDSSQSEDALLIELVILKMRKLSGDK